MRGKCSGSPQSYSPVNPGCLRSGPRFRPEGGPALEDYLAGQHGSGYNLSMIRVFCGVLALAIMASGMAKADEPVGLEVRKRSAIGALGLVRVQLSTKVAADGSILATFNAPGEGSYVLMFTSGPETGKVAMTVKVHKAGPVTAKIRPRRR